MPCGVDGRGTGDGYWRLLVYGVGGHSMGTRHCSLGPLEEVE